MLPSDLRAADARLVQVGRRVHLLGALGWPPDVLERFEHAWHQGRPTLPDPPPPPRPDPDAADELVAVARVDRKSPIGAFLAETAESYLAAIRVVEGAGTEAGHLASRGIFGGPSDRIAGADLTHREAADRLLDVTAPLVEATRVHAGDVCITAETVAATLRERFVAFFGEASPEVEIDPALSAKAAASAMRVRVRGRTCFSEDDIAQLVEHEGFVHAATALSGRRQPHLTALGLTAPRTTATQEGLATLAELVTGAMDLARLRRLALRVVAVDMAMSGADFLDVFRFFLEQGHTEAESARAAARVFRGGDVRGRWVFTKDVVYLHGLLAVHTFLRRAIADGHPHLVDRLFVGRLTLGDVLRLEGSFGDGTIAPAAFVPRWAARRPALAAYLSFSGLINRIDLSRVDLRALWGGA